METGVASFDDWPVRGIGGRNHNWLLRGAVQIVERQAAAICAGFDQDGRLRSGGSNSTQKSIIIMVQACLVFEDIAVSAHCLMSL